MNTRRTLGAVLVDASAIATPFLDVDTVVTMCAQFEQSVKTWLPSADVIFLFSDDAPSDWAVQMRAGLNDVGLRVSSPAGLERDKRWTRNLWFIHDGFDRRSPHMRADRVEHVEVPWGSMPPFEVIAAKVAHYVALMGYSAALDESGIRTTNFDDFGIIEDEPEL